ncbi:MAG: hypothetical protein AB7I79_15215 [Rhizobiaceae bacterium]
MTMVACLAAQPAAAWSDRWSCGTADQLSTAVIVDGSLTLNNFILRERIGLSGVPHIELTLSAVNRGNDNAYVSIQFLAVDGNGHGQFVISAAPFLDVVQPGASAEIKESVYTTGGELSQMVRFCLRLDGRIP